MDDDEGPLGVDPLNAGGVITVASLQCWADTEAPNYKGKTTKNGTHASHPFPFDEQLNRKVVVWSGDITTIDTDVITNSTNESLNDRNATSERIHRAAGRELRAECRRTEGCRTGEAKITKGYNLPALHVVHTVGPRYNVKYKTAAESALYNCYRSVLQLVVEHGLHSVSLCVVNSIKRGYPPESGAHLALRTVRRFLEKHGQSLERVVFVCEDMDRHIYDQLMPLYFPRSAAEGAALLGRVPADIGNEEGEPVIAERTIRIMDTPLAKGDEEAILTTDDLSKESAGAAAFMAMASDHDHSRRSQLASKTPAEIEEMEQRARYQRWLRRARTLDYTEFDAHRMLYSSGLDSLGRPIICFVGRQFPATKVDLDKAIAYFIHTMDALVSRDYAIVYFHTGVTSENQPAMAWMRQVYQLIDQKYKKNLKNMYIVHPTFWSRCVLWWFLTFTAPSVKEKIKSVDSIADLQNLLNHEKLEIPHFVVDYDRQYNGANYASTDL